MNAIDIMNSVLFKLDPANTCCAENEAYDEYESVANSIIEDLKSNSHNLRDSIKKNMKFYFELEEDEYDLETIIDCYLMDLCVFR